MSHTGSTFSRNYANRIYLFIIQMENTNWSNYGKELKFLIISHSKQQHIVTTSQEKDRDSLTLRNGEKI